MAVWRQKRKQILSEKNKIMNKKCVNELIVISRYHFDTWGFEKHELELYSWQLIL